MQGVFEHCLFVTSGSSNKQSSGASYAPLLVSEENQNESSEVSDIATSNESNLNVSYGRPDYLKELQDLSIWGSNAIVFACGPAAMIESCSDTALKYGISFHSETFEF